ncbi:hypothetical protein BU15DRAFT_80408 [Melanogaster broomeanus]|nr:hypothetical protein BU15DRAFT_80408 [Melanogaster broomeanus]
MTTQHLNCASTSQRTQDPSHGTPQYFMVHSVRTLHSPLRGTTLGHPTRTLGPPVTNYAAAQTYMEVLVTGLPNTVAITVPPITDGGIFIRSLPPGKGRNAALNKYKNLGMTGYRVAQHCVDAIWTLNSDAYSSVYDIPPTDWKEVMNRCVAFLFFLLELLTGPDLVGIPDYHMSSLRHLLAKESVESSSTSKEWSIRTALAAVLALESRPE